MATITTTSLELQPLENQSSSRLRDRERPSNAADPLNVAEASRLADSTVPDGGYGWVVIAGCAIVAWWGWGTTYSWGVVQSALVEDGVSSPAKLSFIGSLTATIISVLAIINSRLTRLLGVRFMAMAGISLIGVGAILSSLVVRNVNGLFATVGGMMGLGSSFAFAAMSVLPAQYFSKKRGLANGIVFAGGGLGGAVTSLMLDSLIQRVGLAWAYRVLGLMTLAIGLPAAWLIKERTAIKTTGFVEWRLFRDFRFAVLFLVGAIATFPLMVPPFFLPLYGRSIGLSSSTSAGLVACFNMSSAISRIFAGFSCDKFGPLNTLCLAMFLGAVSMLALWPVSTTLGPMVLFAMLNGVSNGGFFAVMPTVIGNIFGSARLSVAMGMIVTGWGGGYMMGAPIAGYILQAYGGAEEGFQAYRPAIFYAGSMALGSAILALAVKLRSNRNLMAKI